MSRKIINKIGIRYGRLVVIEFVKMDWNGCKWFATWLCRCDCGNETVVSGNNLQRKNTQSCGCLHQEIMSEQVGKNNSNYIDGKYTKAIFKLREQRRKKDNYTCQDCGIKQEEYKKKYNRILDIHHIDGDDTNNIEENMITLCISCHLKTR